MRELEAISARRRSSGKGMSNRRAEGASIVNASKRYKMSGALGASPNGVDDPPQTHATQRGDITPLCLPPQDTTVVSPAPS